MNYQQYQQPSAPSSLSIYYQQSVTPSNHHLQESKNDNLEYYIKFPSPNLTHERPINTITQHDNDYVFVYNETNVPIIMLLGWAGCQDKYLMKYSKIYEDRGYVQNFV